MSMLQVGGYVPIHSREGRDTSRYNDQGARLVAGTIPIKFDGSKCPANVRVLLISSKDHSGWVFPKGGWESDEDIEDAARRETVEEAGVRGELEFLVGQFGFVSGKSRPQHKPPRTGLATIYCMTVMEELGEWPESYRERQWVTFEQGVQMVRHDWMRAALRSCEQRLGWLAASSSSSDATTATQIGSDDLGFLGEPHALL